MISPSFVFVEHRVLILELHRVYFTNLFTIYWALEYYI